MYFIYLTVALRIARYVYCGVS